MSVEHKFPIEQKLCFRKIFTKRSEVEKYNIILPSSYGSGLTNWFGKETLCYISMHLDIIWMFISKKRLDPFLFTGHYSNII